MIKRILYHSGFTLLGVGLLVGMATLQNSQRMEASPPSQESITQEPYEPLDQPAVAPAPAVTVVAPKPRATPRNAAPAPSAPKPPVVVPRFVSRIKEINIYSPSDASTRKFFPANEQGYLQALAHYKKLAQQRGDAVWKNMNPDGRWSELPPEFIE